MAINRISRAFKDISLSFVPHPVTNDLPILRNESAIARSVRNLVETIPTERFFNPTIGSNIRSSLFDFVDIATASTIKRQIEITLDNYEPRIENIVVEVFPDPDNNSFDLNIIYDIIGQDFPTQQINFILEATR
jgi:phage baseplate assembly protein W